MFLCRWENLVKKGGVYKAGEKRGNCRWLTEWAQRTGPRAQQCGMVLSSKNSSSEAAGGGAEQTDT